MSKDQISKLVDNALKAREACQSDWGRNYWQTVVASLVRSHERTIH